MEHGSAEKLEKNDASVSKSRLGVALFMVYLLVYGGFVAINTVNPKLMGKSMFLGLNLATVYGFGLIILAIVMGLIYNRICTGYEAKLDEQDEEGAAE